MPAGTSLVTIPPNPGIAVGRDRRDARQQLERVPAMDDNVIKFKRPEPVKPPRRTPPWLRRYGVAIVLVLGFAATYAYFAMTGPQ